MEERRAAGEGLTDGELAAEVGGHIVDELSDDERALDGGQAALQSELNRQRDDKETNQLMRAVATGKLALMRGAARRGSAGLSSFARNVADVDDEDDDAEAEGDEEARLAAEEEARHGEGDSVLRDDDDEEEEDPGSAGLEGSAHTEDEDGAFDFEAEMAARVAEQSRRDRVVAAAGGVGSAGARGFSGSDSTTLAAQLLGDDEDSEALLAKMRTQPQQQHPLRRIAPVSALSGVPRKPLVSAAAAASSLGLGRASTAGGSSRGPTNANPLDMQHQRQQEQIAPMPTRVVVPPVVPDPLRKSSSSVARMPPAAAAGAKPGALSATRGESVYTTHSTPTLGLPRGSPPGSSPFTALLAPPLSGFAETGCCPSGRNSDVANLSRAPLATLVPAPTSHAPAPASCLSARDNAGGGANSSRGGHDTASKAGPVGFMAAAGSGVRRSDSQAAGAGSGSSLSLGGATFAGAKSLMAQQQHGPLGAGPGAATGAPFAFSAASKAGVAAGGLVSVATGKHVVFAGAEDASRSRAGGGPGGQGSLLPPPQQLIASGDAGSSRGAALCRTGSGSRTAHSGGPVGFAAAPASFAGTPSLFAVLKRTPTGA